MTLEESTLIDVGIDIRELVRKIALFQQDPARAYLGDSPLNLDLTYPGRQAELRVLGVLLSCMVNEPSAVVSYRLRDPANDAYELADLVVFSPRLSFILVEVKNHPADDIRSVEGDVEVPYGQYTRRVLEQVNAAFDLLQSTINDVAKKHDLSSPTGTRVVWFPRVTRREWAPIGRRAGLSRTRFFFKEDLAADPTSLLARLEEVASPPTPRRRSRRRPSKSTRPPLDVRQTAAVRKALHDSTVLRRLNAARGSASLDTIGGAIDILKNHGCLSRRQRHLIGRALEGSPALIRGVAGSGKSLVLVENLVETALRAHLRGYLDRPIRFLVVAYNKTLEAQLSKLISDALEDAQLDLSSVFWQTINESDFEWFENSNLAEDGDPAMYDMAYIDDAQDFSSADIAMVHDRVLWAERKSQERSLVVLVDEGQALFGDPSEPDFDALPFRFTDDRVITLPESFRCPREVATVAINGLLGAEERSSRPADMSWLQSEGLLAREDDGWLAAYARRPGPVPQHLSAPTATKSVGMVCDQVVDLIENEEVLPEDILILPESKWRELAPYRRELEKRGVSCNFVREDKEQPIFVPGRVTLCSIHSARGYGAPVVFMVNAGRFLRNDASRRRFYVGATRCQYLLVLSSAENDCSAGCLLDEVLRVRSRLTSLGCAAEGDPRWCTYY